MNFSITRAFVTIAVANWQQSLDFYQGLLQLTPKVLQADRYAEFQRPDGAIALYQPRSEESPQSFPANHYPSMSLCLQVPDLQAAIAHLERMGYAPPAGIQRSQHGQEIYIYDPNGNRIILYEPS
jgi:catechol 2,3-dioxygenase-like lactoylglutathione lyase family enzyme